MKNRLNFVINSVYPYQYEITSILALPEGSKIRLRYETPKWVDLNSVKEGSLNIGMEGYLFLNCSGRFQKGVRAENLDNIANRYYPLRKIKLYRADIIGEIYYFECFLDGYFDYPTSYLSTGEHGKLVSTFSNKNKLVFIDQKERELSSGDFRDINSDINDKKWMKTVLSLIEEEEYSKLDFYRISKICKTDIGKREGVTVANGHLELEEAESYQIFINQYRKNAKIENDGFESARGIELVKGLNIFPDNSFAMAVGKYDVLKLSFSVARVKYSQHSEVILKYTLPRNLEQRIDRSLTIPIKILKKTPSIITRLVGMVVFGVLYIGQGFSFIPQNLLEPHISNLIRDLSLIGFIVTLIDLKTVLCKRK